MSAYSVQNDWKCSPFTTNTQGSAALLATSSPGLRSVGKKPLIDRTALDALVTNKMHSYKLVAMKLVTPSKEHLEKHYEDLSEKPFFKGLVKCMIPSIFALKQNPGDQYHLCLK